MRNRLFAVLALLLLLAMASERLVAVSPGPSPDENPEGNTGALKAQIQTGGSYDAHSGNATRTVTDLQLPGAPGVYGLDFTRYWNSLHNNYDDIAADLPMDFGASGWSHSWKWSAIGDTAIEQSNEGGGSEGRQIYTTSITITFPDGHATKYKIIRSNIPFYGQPPGCVNPSWGPPYSAACGEDNWNALGLVHDRLRGMAQNGSSFWLERADGGSVYFEEGGPLGYQAKKVYDPHGLRTDLQYNAYGDLEQIAQEGGRSLTLTWGYFNGWGRAITRVQCGGLADSQYVTYKYTRLNGPNGFLVLAVVGYMDNPTLPVTANYRYELQSYSTLPLLRYADDPRFAGPMRNIHYTYKGDRCHPWEHPATDLPEARLAYFYANPESITAESSGDHVDQFGQVLVSHFRLDCWSGTRLETSGLGGSRWFYFGRAAGPQGGYYNKGYELGKLTDFTTVNPPPDNLPFRHQYGGIEPRQVWDGRGKKTEFLGWNSGHPGEVRYADNSDCTYEWVDPGSSAELDTTRIHNSYHHWLFEKKDERGYITKYTRDHRRRVSRIDYPDASFEIFVYDNDNNDPNGLNQVTSHRLPSGAIETYEYDPNTHLLMVEYNSVNVGDRKEYVYDGVGRVWKMRDGRAIHDGADYTVMMEYNARHQVTKVHYRPTGGSADPTVRYEYDKYGNCTAIIDELDHRKDFTYDSYRRCTSYTEQLDTPGWDGNGIVASRRWDWIYDREVEGVPGVRSAFSHTSKEWRIQIEPVFNDGGERRMTARKFDLQNRITLEQTGWIQSDSAPLGNGYEGPDIETHRFSYDQNGQKSTYTDTLQRVTNYDYDDRNRLSRTTENPQPGSTISARVTQTYYDPAGNKTLVVFPDQTTQQWPTEEYTAFGQPRKFIDENFHRTDMEYYPWGPMKKLASVTTYRTKDASSGGGEEPQPTTFEHDLMGRALKTVFPDTSDEISTYQLGQLKTFQTRRGATKTITYDARGRETSHTWSDGMTSSKASSWDDANRLVSLGNNIAFIDYVYDSAGQMLVEGTAIAGSGTYPNARKEVKYCRYPNGDVSRIAYPDGSTVVGHNYTVRGQLEGVGWGPRSMSYAYYPDGRVNYQAYTGGMHTKCEYNGRGMISSIRHKKYDTPHDLAFREYWRDDRDRITAWKRGVDSTYNGMEDGRGDRYLYDNEGQLKLADYRVLDPETETPREPKRRDRFDYDELGNRMGSNELANRGTVNFTRDDNGLNQYRTWYSVTNYDDDVGGQWGSPGTANGVLMQEGYITASFNALNQPMAIWSPAYPNGPSAQYMWFGFDPLGRCVKRWVSPLVDNHAPPVNTNPATYYFYDGWNLVQEGPNAATADRIYVHGSRVDEIVASRVGGQWYFHHYDARGHCIMLTNAATAELVEQYDYDAFGNPYFHTASGSRLVFQNVHTRFLFTGREYLPELRLYDFRHRMYQPELGRFLQPDPKQFDAGDYNLYRYCHNDPVNKSDPTGLNSLTGWGGGDWKWFNGGVALAQLNAISLQKEAASMRFVPTNFANDSKTVRPSSTDHTGGIYEYQFSSSTGQRKSGVGVTVLEKLKTVAGEDVGHAQKQKAPLQSNGIFRDHVGSNRRPSHADDGRYSISHQTFQVERNGEAVPVSTKLGHDVRFINGEVVPRVWVIDP